MTHVVYGFREAGSAELRYVGQTKYSGNHRLRFERSLARAYMRDHKRYGYKSPIGAFRLWLCDAPVEAVQIATCLGEADARRRERETIEACLSMGHRLFNAQHVPAALRTPRMLSPRDRAMVFAAQGLA